MRFRVRLARWKRLIFRRKVTDDMALLFRFASMYLKSPGELVVSICIGCTEGLLKTGDFDNA